MAGDV